MGDEIHLKSEVVGRYPTNLTIKFHLRFLIKLKQNKIINDLKQFNNKRRYLLHFSCILMNVFKCYIWYPDVVYPMVKCKTSLEADDGNELI